MTTTHDPPQASDRARALAILAQNYHDALEMCPHWDYGADASCDPVVHDCCLAVDITRRAYRAAKRRAALGGGGR